jgi:carbon monoxide dehydrogenase subunit G
MELTNDFRVALPVERAWAVLTDVERIAPCLPGAQLQEVEGDVYRGIVKIKVGPITAQYKGQATFLEQDEANHVAVLRAEGRETRGQGSANATITATLTPDADGTAVSVVTDLTVTGRVAQFGRGVLADVSANLLGQFVTCLEQTVLAGEDAVRPAAGPTTASAAGTTAATTKVVEASAAEAGGGGSSGTSADEEAEAEAVAAAGSLAGAPASTAASDGDAPPKRVADAEMAAAAPTEAVTVEDSGPAPTDAPVVRKIDSPEPTPVDLMGAAGSPVAKRVGPVLAVVAVVWLLKKLLSRGK